MVYTLGIIISKVVSCVIEYLLGDSVAITVM